MSAHFRRRAILAAVWVALLAGGATGASAQEAASAAAAATAAADTALAGTSASPSPSARRPGVLYFPATMDAPQLQLRIVRREETAQNIAGQVMLGVAMALLTRSAGASGFSKNDLAGDVLDGVPADLARNPAMGELSVAVADAAVRLQQERQGESSDAVAALPAELPVAVFAGRWHLVYENLGTDDGLYRLSFGASLNWKPRPFAVHARPQLCSHQSEPLSLAQWQADGWKALGEARAKALGECTQVFAKVLPDWL